LALAQAGRDDFPEDVFTSADRIAAASATQLIAATDSLTAATWRIAGFTCDVWQEPPLLLDMVPPLNPGRLGGVRDDTWFGNFERAMPEDIPKEARDEDAAYWQAVLYASKIPAGVFAEAAQKNRYLTFGHLYGEPAKYRGRIVHFEGKLVRLKRLDPPPIARGRGVRTLYEAWIYLDQPGTHPICVIMAHQPAGVEVGDDLRLRVGVDGYFFKRYRYISGRLDKNGNNESLSTVLIVAPTLVPVAVAPHRGESWGRGLWPWLVGFGLGVALLIVGMTWWFRRSDGRVEARLKELRAAALAMQIQVLAPDQANPDADCEGHS
jgi:hypothetical protein